MEHRNEERRFSVLVMEDDDALAQLLQTFLEKQGWLVHRASTAAQAKRISTAEVFDLVLADYFLPDAKGVSIFDEIQIRSPLTKILLMTGAKDIEVASEAFRQGASDLISKPFTFKELEKRIRVLLEEKEQLLMNQQGDSPPPSIQPQRFVGSSSEMKKVFRLIDLVARHDATVLITGESGTGKELAARAVHDASPRRSHPFVAINCAAIPELLLEDELFGHVRGAYTDARESRAGRFEAADGGTVFLDEIGDMPLVLQTKLLRVLEQREFQRLGSNRTVRVDVRVIAATNSDLEAKVADGDFREDLYYRLKVIPVHMPALRERREDVPLLAAHFLRQIGATCEMTPKKLDTDALKLLMSHHWSGNVRELRNLLEFASVLAGETEFLTEVDFPSLASVSILDEVEEQVEAMRDAFRRSDFPVIPEDGIDLNKVVSDLEKHLICQSLQRTNGNKRKAAELLFLKRTTLVEKLRRMKLLDHYSSRPAV